MADPKAPAAGAGASAPKKTSGEPRYLVLLALTIVGAFFGGLFASIAMGALLVFLPAFVGVLVGMLFGFALPIFLALRASSALKRRGMPMLLRRLVVGALICATQIAVIGGVLTWTSRGTGELAATAWRTFDTFGGLPILSGLLENHAIKQGALPKKQERKPKVGPDGGVLLGPDGGILYEDPPDAGVIVGADGGTTAPKGDGGTATVAADGGVATTASDAGTAPAIIVPSSAYTLQPPKPKADAALSPRAAGKTVRTIAAAVQTDTGDQVIVVGSVAAAGAFSTRVIDLAAHEKLGAPTLVEVADDGSVAAILDGTHLVTARAGKTTADVVKSVSAGAKLLDVEVRGTKDVVVAPGGAMLAVLEVLAKEGEVQQRLVSIPKQGPPTTLRKAGDVVPQASPGSVAASWTFKKHGGTGSLLIVETFHEGNSDVGVKLGGEQYTLNPQRLLSVKIDAPKAQIEIARTGVEPSGIDGLELQAFGDAFLLADGRAIFDANFIERGPEGWLFSGKQGAGVFALAPDLRSAAPGTASLSLSAPRAQHLDAIVEGHAVFRRPDGAIVMFALDAPANASATLLGAEAVGSDGKKRGTITNVDVPYLARGGEWLVAGATVSAAVAASGHDAIVLASKADRENGKAEIVLEAGAVLPEVGAVKPRKVQSIRVGRGREEILWRK